MTALPARDVSTWAGIIAGARRRGQVLEPLTDHVSLTLDDAYAVQREVFVARIARGERPAGWKLGYTSEAMRTQMGVAEPNFGPLTDRMLLAEGTPVPADAIQPRVEPEIAVVVGEPLGPEPSRDDVSAAARDVRCALEIVDSVWRDYRFRIEDNTADGSSAAYVVLGPALDPDCAWDRVPVTLAVDGEEIATATGAAAMGHPADAVAWLATALATRGERLAPGDVVITGGLTPSVPLAVGSTACAVFAGTRTVRTARPRRRV